MTYPLTNSIHSRNAKELYEMNLTGEGFGYRTIPVNWLRYITFPTSKKPNAMACFILSEIIFRHRACAVGANNGKGHRLEKYFKGDKLQISYTHFMDVFGITKVEATRYCLRLKNLKLIKLHFGTVEYKDKKGRLKKAGNVMYIQVFPKEIKRITFGDDGGEVSTSKSIGSTLSTQEPIGYQPEGREAIDLKVETNTKEVNTNKTNTNKKIKDQQSTVKSKPTASLHQETSPPSFPQNFEAEILHNDKRLKGEKVMFTRKGNIYEGYVLNQSPKRLTIGVPEGHGLKNMVLNASSKDTVAYQNGKLYRVTWAAPDINPGLPEPIRTVLKELKETIDPDFLLGANEGDFRAMTRVATKMAKSKLVTPGSLIGEHGFSHWYYNVHIAWQDSPNPITHYTIKNLVGKYNRWMRDGRKPLSQSTGYKNGKTPFGQGYGLQTKAVVVEANDEVFIPEEF